MRSVNRRLEELGIVLPKPPQPGGTYVPAVRHQGLVFLSGQGPIMEDGRLATGKVGAGVTVEQANAHARRAGLGLLAVLEQFLGSLDRVEQIVKLLGMVNAVPDFEQQPAVINGCSDLLVEVFGERGRHARSAVGMGSLPGNITVEIEAVVAVRPE